MPTEAESQFNEAMLNISRRAKAEAGIAGGALDGGDDLGGGRRREAGLVEMLEVGGEAGIIEPPVLELPVETAANVSTEGRRGISCGVHAVVLSSHDRYEQPESSEMDTRRTRQCPTLTWNPSGSKVWTMPRVLSGRITRSMIC